MYKNLIFFSAFRECFEDDARDLSLVEPEGPVVGPAYQVVGVFCLYDSRWTGHSKELAHAVPKMALTPESLFPKLGVYHRILAFKVLHTEVRLLHQSTLKLKTQDTTLEL